MIQKMSAPQKSEPEEGSLKTHESGDGRETHGITAPLSKHEAVRRALAAGFEGAQEGTKYVRKEFGIASSHFLAIKATERKKGWTKHGKPGRKPKHTAEAGHVTASLVQKVEGEDGP